MGKRTIFDMLKGEPHREETESFCVPSAIHDAWVWEIKKGDAVRLATTKIKKTDIEDIDHVQAQAYIDGKWIYLTSHNAPDGRKIVTTWENHYPDKEPYKYTNLDDYIAEQRKR